MTRIKETELNSSLKRLCDIIAPKIPSVEELKSSLIGKASEHYDTHEGVFFGTSAKEILSINDQLGRFAELKLERSRDRTDESLEELASDFVEFLTRPIKFAEMDVGRLEGELFDTLSNHPALKIRNSDFSTDTGKRRAVENLESLVGSVSKLSSDVADIQQRILDINKVLLDPEMRIEAMAVRLNNVNNFLTKLSLCAEAMTKFIDNDVKRSKWLVKLHVSLTDQLDVLFEEGTAAVKVEASKQAPASEKTSDRIHALPAENTYVAGAMNLMGSEVKLTVVLPITPMKITNP